MNHSCLAVTRFSYLGAACLTLCFAMIMLTLAALVTESTWPAACDGALLFGMLCFEYFDQPLPWAEAEAACVVRGGHLASLHSTRENLLAHALCSEACWIGFTDATYEGIWIWSDGSGFNFSQYPDNRPPWNPGEPNGRTHETTDAAYMYPRSNAWVTAGRWDDDDMRKRKPFLCKRMLAMDVAPQPAGILRNVPEVVLAFSVEAILLAILYWAGRCAHQRMVSRNKPIELEPLTPSASQQIELY